MTEMIGKIYDVSGKIGGARTTHPHVIVIELADDCLLIPAYTTGGQEIEDYKAKALVFLGLRPDQAFVELDNAVHVDFYDGRPGNVATWLVERVDRWPRSELVNLTPVGEMKDRGLLANLETFLRLTEARPDRFSASLVKRLRKLTEEVRGRCAPSTKSLG